LGDRGAGEDAHRLAGLQHALIAVARRALAGDVQRDALRGVLRPHRPAVHGRGIERGLVSDRVDRMGEDAALGLLDGDGLHAQQPDFGEHAPAGLFDGEVLHGLRDA